MKSTCIKRSSPKTPKLLIFWGLALLLAGFPKLLFAQSSPPTNTPEKRRAVSTGPTNSDKTAQGARRTRKRSARSRSASRTSRRSRSRAKRKITVPVELGVGPAFFAFANPFSDGNLLSGPLTEDQSFRYGLRINLAAIITHDFVRKHPRLVPRKYRSMFKPGSEVRYTPGVLALIPRDLIISPKVNHTGVYGATWEFLRLGINLLGSAKSNLSVGAGLLATYAYIDSDLANLSTHFLRPGISLGLSAGTMLSDSFGLSIGWNSNFYIPQAIGGGILELGEGQRSLWHIGEAFLMLRFRFPYTTTL